MLPEEFLLISSSSSAMLLLATHKRYPDSVSAMDESVRADCHFGKTHRAYCLGVFFVVAEMLGLLASRSLGDTHPASIATATAAIKIRMSFPLWFGGNVALRGRCKKPSAGLGYSKDSFRPKADDQESVRFFCVRAVMAYHEAGLYLTVATSPFPGLMSEPHEALPIYPSSPQSLARLLFPNAILGERNAQAHTWQQHT
ncbi:hypothetical protein HX891_14415 [Pseudomonas reactans]|uniref:hypothetical protein n=1 Tax=Pseudomonas reactans TaxID=117680 RepID=UPI0015B822B8|nr:hypothetical protein [Pseudomonas reactans]NWD81574.1 hypothetical protein [Pseudomonas reactans]